MSERLTRGKKEQKAEEADKEKPEEVDASPEKATTTDNNNTKLEEALSPNAAAPSGPTPRDIILGEGSEDHRANLLLQDLISLHILVCKSNGKPLPKKENDVTALTERLFQLTKKGKGRDLAGLKDVPRPFLVGSGRFLKSEGGGEWKELNDDEARALLNEHIFSTFKTAEQDNEEEESETFKGLKKEFEEYLAVHSTEKETEIKEADVKPADVILLQRSENEGDKSYENQGGNKAMFTLASQHVNSEATSPSKRLEAALSVFLSKGSTASSGTEAEKTEEKEEEPSTGRFIFCKTNADGQRSFFLVKPVDAAEVTLLFVFEVWLEKELAGKRDAAVSSGSDGGSGEIVPPGIAPVDAPTPHDVLFGRGGMTNSHSGNKRFRDVIALHRPDYIKAIKNDKPNVARKIVRAIRTASPPGRFLKKNDDGKWYDTGDKVAAEKASQALREKSNAEKRQRSAQREAQRGTKGEGSGGQKTKKAKTTDAAISSPLLPPLNYVGATLASTTQALVDAAKSKEGEDPNTEGLPPNAVDKDGNILVTDWDILCGRGGATNHHRGNKRFRDIVALHRPDYIRAPKVQKPSVARVIVRAIRNGDPPGRFLKKDEKTGHWYDVGDKKAAEKTSQALREKGPDKGEGATNAAAAGGSPAFLLPTPTMPAALDTAAAAAAAQPADEEQDGKEKTKEEAKEGEAKEEKDEDAPKPEEETKTVTV